MVFTTIMTIAFSLWKKKDNCGIQMSLFVLEQGLVKKMVSRGLVQDPDSNHLRYHPEAP
jgi:hypothetical protein